MTKFLKILLLIGAIFGIGLLAAPNVIWDGTASLPIKITVRSAEGRVSSGATVSLIQSGDEWLRGMINEEEFSKHLAQSKHRFESDQTGTGVLQGQFGAGGSTGPFRRTGHFIVSGDLTVSHPDYVGISLPLANFVEDRRISIREKELFFTVYLRQKTTERAGTSDRDDAPSSNRASGTRPEGP